MPYDYFIFDLDNCLIRYPNLTGFIDEVLKKTLKNYLKDIPKKFERNTLLKPGTDINEKLRKWGISEQNFFWMNYEQIEFQYRKHLAEAGNISLFKDVRFVLKSLKQSNKKLAIVSNSPQYIVDYFTKRFCLDSFFQESVGVDYSTNPNGAKPSPNGIRMVLNKMGYDQLNSKAIMIGDSIVDIIAAKKAEITACLVKRNRLYYYKRLNEWSYQPDMLVKTLHELISI
ncbi:MAG: HAD family hydrolase [Candidatus Lokiarchaeota archaeon]|nr:HAD family hydrolase [Candidatus Lokiarchaeota archaeon]